MRAVIQRVTEADVKVNQDVKNSIAEGLVVLLGVKEGDKVKDAVYLAEKTAHLRIFEDQNGVMNRSVLEEAGEVLVISQFTLFGDCRKGRRPSYAKAARPETAIPLYELFISELKKLGLTVATGEFQAMMKISLVNDGPVTILLDSEKSF